MPRLARLPQPGVNFFGVFHLSHRKPPVLTGTFVLALAGLTDGDTHDDEHEE